MEGCLIGGGQRRHYESVRERWKIDIIQEMILVKQGVIFMDKKYLAAWAQVLIFR